MSSMPRVVPEDDTFVIESLDSAIPCRYLKKTGCAETAAFAVWSLPKYPCGCDPWVDFIYLCQSHWDRLTSPGVTPRCDECGTGFAFLETVSRWERI